MAVAGLAPASAKEGSPPTSDKLALPHSGPASLQRRYGPATPETHRTWTCRDTVAVQGHRSPWTSQRFCFRLRASMHPC